MSDQTNDEQGKYHAADPGKEVKRKPLLSDADLRHIDEGRFNRCEPHFGREAMRAFYEAKITSGELVVVKTARGVSLPPSNLMWGCDHCERAWTKMDNFCPGCGAKIIEG